MYILRTEKKGGSKLMFMTFEIVYVYGFGTFFRKMSYCSLFTFILIAHVRASCH